MKFERSLILMGTVLVVLWHADGRSESPSPMPATSAVAEQGQDASGPGKPGTELDNMVGSQKVTQVTRATYDAKLLGNLTSPTLREASGLAISTRNSGLFWSHNDSGYGPYVFVFDEKGEDRGRFYLEKARSGDWEDMAAFRWRNQSWLLMADTGDNSSRKASYTLYLVEEPELSPRRSPKLRPLQGVQRARIAYPSGPADTEAVAVDSIEQRIYLITKRERPAQVFSLPLSVFKDDSKVHMARFETKLFNLPSPTLQNLLEHPKMGLAFAQPNALDFSPDRSFAIVHTYGHSYRFTREMSQSWAEAFANAPQQFDVPSMQQSEAVAIGADNRSIYYTSEGRYPPFYQLTPAEPNPMPVRQEGD